MIGHVGIAPDRERVLVGIELQIVVNTVLGDLFP